MTAKDLRVGCSSGGVSGCGEVGVGELFVVEGESGGHGLLSVWRDAVEALVGDAEVGHSPFLEKRPECEPLPQY
jgi:hypothetical protein